MEGAAVLVGEHQHIRRRAVALRADAGALHPSQQSAHDEAVCHAAAVAAKAALPARKAAPAFPNGHQVGQHLTGTVSYTHLDVYKKQDLLSAA